MLGPYFDVTWLVGLKLMDLISLLANCTWYLFLWQVMVISSIIELKVGNFVICKQFRHHNFGKSCKVTFCRIVPIENLLSWIGHGPLVSDCDRDRDTDIFVLRRILEPTHLDSKKGEALLGLSMLPKSTNTSPRSVWLLTAPLCFLF